MEFSKIFEIFIAVVSFLYVFVGLIINAVERGVANADDDVKFSERYASSTESAIKSILMDPVMNVSVIDTSLNQSCPTGSTSTIYRWSTSEIFCQCKTQVYRRNCAKRSSCSSSYVRAFDMSNWKKKKICLGRIKATDWSYATAEGPKGCPNNFMRCP